MTTITAVFDRLDGSPPYEREVTLVIRGGYVHMRGGPTGFESAPVAVLASDKPWAACFGTPGRWAECIVPVAELRRAAAALAADVR